MKIKHLGQSAFIIKSQTTLVTDPFNPMIGRMPADLTAAVVTVSHSHSDHNYTKGVGGSPQIINQLGNFSIGGFEISGVKTFHDDVGGKKRGENIVYTIRTEGITLCHGFLSGGPQSSHVKWKPNPQQSQISLRLFIVIDIKQVPIY